MARIKIDPLKIVYGEYGQKNVLKTSVRDTPGPFSSFLMSHYHACLS